jgi:SAM-dependent methyltransferase
MVDLKIPIGVEARMSTLSNDSEIVSYAGPALRKRSAFIVKQAERYVEQTLRSQPKVLDIGCGLGSISLAMGQKGYKVVGVDMDPNTVSFCNKRNQLPNIDFKVGDGENLDLGDTFDIVIASEVLEHSPHPESVIRSMSKHLRENGIGLLSVPNGYCPWELVVSRCIQKSKLGRLLYGSTKAYMALTGSKVPFYSMNVDCFHVWFFSFDKLERMLIRNGFKLILVCHSDLGILPEWSSFQPLKRIECSLADIVPRRLAGGWLVVIRKN